MAGSYAALYYHIVFSTKDRQPVLRPEILHRVCEYMGGIMLPIDGIPVMIDGTADRVHALGAFGKSRALSDAVRDLKASSSRWIHEAFPDLGEFAWQEGYGAFSISATGLCKVSEYISGQEEHHRTVSFQEEFIGFLTRHGIAYDERYIRK